MKSLQQINDFLVSAIGMEFQDLKAFLDLGKRKTIPKKGLLAEPGMLIEHAYFVIDGIVRYYIVDKSSEEFTKHFVSSPSFVVASIPDFFLRTSDSIHCEALTELEVVEWTYDQLIDFGMKHSKFMHFLLTRVVIAYSQKEEKEISMHTLDAKERYLKFIEDYPDVAYDVPLRYIASFLNIRPETLSRIRAQK